MRWRVLGIGVLAASVGVLGAGPVAAQDTTLPWLFLSSNRAESAAKPPTEAVLLRPNVEETLFLYVHNPTDRKYDFTVVLAAGPTDADEFARTDVSVPARTAPVRITPPRPAADKPAADKPPPPQPLPNGLHLRLIDKDNKDNVRAFKLRTSVRIPSEYVRPEVTVEGEPGTPGHRLTVKLMDRDKTQPFTGRPAKVRLVLSPDLAPAVVPDSTRGSTFQSELPPGGEVTLVASNLRFRGGDRNGIVAVTVDGYDRAFLFQTDFRGRNPTEVKDVRLYLAAPEFAVPGNPIPVRLEADNAPEGAALEFGIDRANTGEYVKERFDTGVRDEKVGVRWADGALAFVTESRDRVVNLDTAGMDGPRKLRLRLLNPKDQDRELATPYETTIVFDTTPPEDVRFGRLGKAIRNRALDVSAFGADPESKVARVLFFMGEPPAADGKPAAGGRVVVARAPAKAGDPYTAQLPLPDRVGPVPIGVRFVNNVGMAKDVTDEVEVAEPPPKPTTGSIKVTVVQGTDEIPQPGATVRLLDEKKAATLKTLDANAKGEVTFKDLPPGKYVVFSNKPRDYTKAEKAVTVEAGKEEPVKLSLKR